jgi:hypothetical protein
MKNKGNFFYVKKPELKQDFTQIPNKIFELELTPTEKLILIYLFSNSETFRVTSYRIEQALGTDRRTVKKALDKFKQLKLVYNINDQTLGIDINIILNWCNSTGILPTILPASTIAPNNSTGIVPVNLSNNTDNSTGIVPVNLSNNTDNSTGIVPVILPVYTGNSTPIIPVELYNNNTKQYQEQKEEQKEKTIRKQQEEIFEVSQNLVSISSNDEFEESDLIKEIINEVKNDKEEVVITPIKEEVSLTPIKETKPKKNKNEIEFRKEFKKIYEHPKFAQCFDNTPKFKEYAQELMKYSISTIAYEVTNAHTKWKQNMPTPHQNEWLLGYYMVKYCLEIPDSNLRKEAINVAQDELLLKINSNHIPQQV